MTTFMSLFEKYLVYQNPHLVTDDEEEEGPLEQIKTGILFILELYTTRFEDSFPQLPSFVPIVINLLTNTNSEPKYDTVSNNHANPHIQRTESLVDGLQGLCCIDSHCQDWASSSNVC